MFSLSLAKRSIRKLGSSSVLIIRLNSNATCAVSTGGAVRAHLIVSKISLNYRCHPMIAS